MSVLLLFFFFLKKSFIQRNGSQSGSLVFVSGKTFETIDPRTGDVIAEIASGDKEDVDLAVAAARDAFDNGKWPRLPGYVCRLSLVACIHCWTFVMPNHGKWWLSKLIFNGI